MSNSLFTDGELKSNEEILAIHEAAQWSVIMSKLEANKGSLASVEFIQGGGVFSKNRERLAKSDYCVYEDKNCFSIKFVGDRK